MAFVGKLILSILMLAAGVGLMKYSVFVTDQISGKFEWAEKYLGIGVGAGTYTFWKLFGLAICILSVLWLFGKIHFGVPEASQTTSFIYNLIV